jgi:hypothetical protein
MLVRLCSPHAREHSTCPTWDVPVQEFFGGKLSPDFRRIFSSVSVRLLLTLRQTLGYDGISHRPVLSQIGVYSFILYKCRYGIRVMTKFVENAVNICISK